MAKRSLIFREDVYVCWLVSPAKFYVNLLGDETFQVQIKQRIQAEAQGGKLNFVRKDSESRLMKLDVDVGDLVLAPSRTFKNFPFLRGRVKAIYEAAVVGIHLKIQFVDVGHEQWVHVEDVCKIPNYLKTIQPLSLECRLIDINPVLSSDEDDDEAEGWSREAVQEFMRMVSNDKVCRMDVYRVSPSNVYECDLFVRYGDVQLEPVSVRQHLLFKRHGHMWTSTAATRLSRVQPVPEMAVSNMPITNMVSEVKLSHVDGPDHVYVHLIDDLALLGEMATWLESSWSSRRSCDVYEPVEGVYVAVKLHVVGHGRIHRGLVERVVPGSRIAQVLLIDHGRRVIACPGDMASLNPWHFEMYPHRLALRVAIHGLDTIFFEGQDLLDGAMVALEDMEGGEKLLMSVVSFDGGDNPNVVFFRQTADKKLKCLGDEIARQFILVDRASEGDNMCDFCLHHKGLARHVEERLKS